MKWPPYLLKLRMHNPRHSFGIWLPLFLIWPIVLVFFLAVFLILSPFAFLAMLFTWRLGWWRPVVLGVPAIFRLVWSLQGLAFYVQGRDGSVEIKLY